MHKQPSRPQGPRPRQRGKRSQRLSIPLTKAEHRKVKAVARRRGTDAAPLLRDHSLKDLLAEYEAIRIADTPV